MKTKTNIIDMTQGKPLLLMLRFSIPMLLANVLQVFYTMADSAIIGRILGINAFAAVGATAAPHFWILTIIMGMSHGFGIVYAQCFGAKDMDGLRRSFVTSVYLIIMIGITIGAAGILFSKSLLQALNTPGELMEGATAYLSILLGGMIITFTYNILGSLLRALGDSKTPLIAMIISSILNILLNIPLVLLFGIIGVAAGTLFAQLTACLYCYFIICRSKVLSGSEIKWDTKSAKSLLRLGLPLGFMNAVIQGGGLVVQWFVNGFGVEFVAGISIAKRMYSLLFIAASAFEGATGTFVAQNFGAKNIKRVKHGVNTMLKLMLATSAIIMAVTIPLRRLILWLMLEGEQSQLNTVLDIGSQQLLLLILGLPVVCLLFVYRASLESIGKPLIPVLSGFMELIFRMASILILLPFFAEWGVLLADPVGWIGATGLLAISYYVILRKISFKNTCPDL